jgi:hypothetical protein
MGDADVVAVQLHTVFDRDNGLVSSIDAEISMYGSWGMNQSVGIVAGRSNYTTSI